MHKQTVKSSWEEPSSSAPSAGAAYPQEHAGALAPCLILVLIIIVVVIIIVMCKSSSTSSKIITTVIVKTRSSTSGAPAPRLGAPVGHASFTDGIGTPDPNQKVNLCFLCNLVDIIFV